MKVNELSWDAVGTKVNKSAMNGPSFKLLLRFELLMYNYVIMYIRGFRRGRGRCS
jgi:hypothetical protein